MSEQLDTDPLLRTLSSDDEGHKLLGRCTIVRRIGHGGMGVVYQGRDRNLGIDVAVKVLTSQHPDAVARFRQEARIAATLNQPNLVRVFDVDDSDGLTFLIMEYVDGETLTKRIKQRGPLTPAQALRLFRLTARGLAEAHKNGIVHRDIKPDNIMISEDGAIRVADLGIAKATGSDLVETMSNVGMGTPRYMSPEQFRDASSVGPASDVYSLGVTMYFALTGEHAIAGDSFYKISRAVCEDPFPAIESRLPNVPAALAAVIERCVEKDHNDRFDSAIQLLRTLRNVDVKPGTAAAPIASEASQETILPTQVGAHGAQPGVDQTMRVGTVPAIDSPAIDIAPIASVPSRSARKPARPRRNLMPWIGGGLGLAVIAAVVVFALGLRGRRLAANSQLARAIAAANGSAGEVDRVGAARLFQHAASTGDALANLWVARLHHYGECGFAEDRDKARELTDDFWPDVEKLADDRHVEACFVVGAALVDGVGTQRDSEAGGAYLRDAADGGDLDATYELGRLGPKRLSMSDAAATEKLRTAADGGHASAMVVLGRRARGDGLTTGAALDWFQRAADRKHPEGQFEVGRARLLGEGVSKDPAGGGRVAVRRRGLWAR